MPHQSANYEICLHTLYVTLSDCNIVTLLHCYIFMILRSTLGRLHGKNFHKRVNGNFITD